MTKKLCVVASIFSNIWARCVCEFLTRHSPQPEQNNGERDLTGTNPQSRTDTGDGSTLVIVHALVDLLLMPTLRLHGSTRVCFLSLSFRKQAVEDYMGQSHFAISNIDWRSPKSPSDLSVRSTRLYRSAFR